MLVTIKAIRDYLVTFCPKHILTNNIEVPIETVLPLQSYIDSSSKNTLYVGLVSELPVNFPQNVICIEDIPISDDYNKLPPVNISILPKETKLGDIYACICGYLLDKHRTLAVAAQFLSTLAKARGLESIVAIAHKVIGNPIIVSDKSWKALAIASDVKEPDDMAWNDFVTNGDLSLEIVSLNIKEKLTDRIEQSPTPFWCKEANMKYPRLFCRVTVGSRPVATVAVIEYSKPFVERDYLLLSMLANAISSEMQKSKFRLYTRGLLYEEFIVDLIEGRLKNSSIIYEKAKSLDLGFKKFLHVITVDIKEFDTNYFSIPYMRNYLEKMINGSKAIIYNDNITIIISYIGESEFYNSDGIILSEFLKKYKLHAGLSRPFTQLEELKDHYLQSIEAIDVGRHISADISIYSYEEYAIYHIVKVCAETSDLKKLYHPKLLYLMEFDFEHKTTFTASLYAYLKHSRNVTNTSKALHLHRNSMIYHLKRIEEIMNFSLSDNDMLLQLELSFRMMKYDKKTQF